VIARSVTQESAIAEAQVIYERRITDLDVECRREVVRTGGLPLFVAANQAFVTFSDDPRLTSPVYFAYITRISVHCPFNKEKKGVDALENACFNDRAHDGIHASAVAAGGENCELHSDVLICVSSQELARLYTIGRRRALGSEIMLACVRIRWGERLDKIER